jgi:hypothetical protein
MGGRVARKLVELLTFLTEMRLRSLLGCVSQIEIHIKFQ